MEARDDNSGPGAPVWDPLVRAGHWLLVTGIVLAWFTRHSGGNWHEIVGYGTLGIIGVRLLWGLAGTRHARFASFVERPGATLDYARQLLQKREPRHLGHNPLGGYMIVALLATVLLVSASGWLYTTDRFWGIAWVETVHLWSTYALFLLVALHVAGVLYASIRHRENLVAAMIHGRKRILNEGAGSGASTEGQSGV